MKGSVTIVFLLGWMVFYHSKLDHPGTRRSLPLQTKSSIIRWDSSTLTRISPKDSSGSYPRMTRLKNGTLLTAYASRGNIVITKSSDEGRTWSSPNVAASQRNAVNMDTPDLLPLQNGNILLCYATRPQAALRRRPDSTKRFEIRVEQSKDGGETWSDEKILYAAGSAFENGCWEPAAVQLPSGELQLFFSDEGIYTMSNEQNISMLRSADNGNTWTTSPQIISFRPAGRDGMPVPLWPKGKSRLLLAIEDPGRKNFKPYILRSEKNGRWKGLIGGGISSRWYALSYSLADSLYAGAPYLRQLSSGRILLSYQSTEGRNVNRDNDAVMRVAVGDANGRNFSNATTPFIIPEGYRALWNGLCVLDHDTVIAVTSTNGYSKRNSEIWMVKGRLVDE